MSIIRKTLRTAASAVLFIYAVVIFGYGVIGSANGRAATILSPSMQPSIPGNSVVRIRTTDVYDDGDAVLYTGDDGKQYVKEVVSSKKDIGAVSYEVVNAGDTTGSKERIRHDQVIGKVSTPIPFIGKFTKNLTTVKGLLYNMAIVLAMAVIIFCLGPTKKELAAKARKAIAARN